MDFQAKVGVFWFVHRRRGEEWPRGRVVFRRTGNLFNVYADRQLLKSRYREQIVDCFGLPEDRTEMLPDSHYRSTERLRA